MVDISHESLIHQWNNLRTWVDQEATDADIYRRLAETASRHSEAEPRFYRDAELQEAIAWQQLQRPTAAWAECYRTGRYWTGLGPALAFLRESRQIRIREHRERRQACLERKQARVERERLLQERSEQNRQARRTARNWSMGLGALAILMLLLAGYAFYLWNDAQEKTRIVEPAEQSATLTAKEAESAREDAENQRNRAEDNYSRPTSIWPVSMKKNPWPCWNVPPRPNVPAITGGPCCRHSRPNASRSKANPGCNRRAGVA